MHSVRQLHWKVPVPKIAVKIGQCCFTDVHVAHLALLTWNKFRLLGFNSINTLRPRQNVILHMTCSNAFLWMKAFEFQIKFHYIYSLESNWQYGDIGSDNGMVLNRRQDIIWTNGGRFCWSKDASLSLNNSGFVKQSLLPIMFITIFYYYSKHWNILSCIVNNENSDHE